MIKITLTIEFNKPKQSRKKKSPSKPKPPEQISNNIEIINRIK